MTHKRCAHTPPTEFCTTERRKTGVITQGTFTKHRPRWERGDGSRRKTPTSWRKPSVLPNSRLNFIGFFCEFKPICSLNVITGDQNRLCRRPAMKTKQSYNIMALVTPSGCSEGNKHSPVFKSAAFCLSLLLFILHPHQDGGR